MQKYHGGLDNKGSSHLIQQKKIFVHGNKEKRKTTWEHNLPKKWTWSQKYESEWYTSPCITKSNNGSHIGECILCEALGENVSSFLYRWEIL